jgi:hypothetical protein
MRVTLWPTWNVRTRLRLFGFGVVLAICGLYCFLIFSYDEHRIRRSLEGFVQFFGARTFERLEGVPDSQSTNQIQTDAKYSRSLLTQLSMSEMCLRFVREKGESPTAVEQLTVYGLPPENRTDPWGHPYRILSLNSTLIIVQSLGPSGTDRVTGQETSILKKSQTKQFFLVQDNLIVVSQITHLASDHRL